MSQDIYYNSNEINLDDLLSDCIIVFDTNILLNLLLLSEEGIKEFKTLIEEITKKNIKLFIPGQVVFEFDNLKFKKLKEPEDNLENFLNNNDSFKEIKKYNEFFVKEEKKISEITNKLTQSMQFLSNKENHPYLEDKHISSIDGEIDKILKIKSKFFEEIKQDFKKIIDTFETSINEQKSNSDFSNHISFLQKIIDENMEKSVSWSYEKKLEFAHEAKIRYEHSIAPGYEDTTKSGLGKYGDFFIWKEILLFGAKEKKNCIFVSEDNKRDWVIKKENKKDRSLTTPDNDLVLEYSSETKKQFWMLNNKEFFYKLGEYTDRKTSKRTMEEVIKISNESNLSQLLTSKEINDNEGIRNILNMMKKYGVILETKRNYEEQINAGLIRQKVDFNGNVEKLNELFSSLTEEDKYLSSNENLHAEDDES